ncbi:MAG: glycine cleavage system aminomethyltransferase GcvT [Phycisphaeraceae bacterium]|nr:glycine cleavage system aminomethyltransferase GcvT [Phycisphaeraceae bacterium]
MTDAASLRRTPLHGFHQQYGAHLVDVAGWEMPLHYGSILEEHKLVRRGAGLFDVSHMGRVMFTGSGARRFLERVLTRRISTMQPGQCRYALVCNEAGGVLDDVIVYRFEDYWMLVVNAANREKLLAHFEQVKAAENFEVKIDDITFKTAMLACQGPDVMQIIGHFTSEVPALQNYHFCQKNLMVIKFTISRTGYTGEDGVEVIMGAMTAPMAIRLLTSEGGSQAAKIKPAGLGARDTLRLEAAMPLYGHELDEQTNPLEAGLNFAVNLDKGAEPSGETSGGGGGPQIPRFIGQDALEKVAAQGVSKQLIGLQLDGKRTPRQGAAVSRDGRQLGVVTSGCLSPTLGYPIALAYVQPQAANVGDAVQVAVGNSVQDARIVKLPFYKRPRV